MGDADLVRDGFARLTAERGPVVRRQHAATIPLSAAAFVAAAVLVPLFLQGSGGSAGPDLIIPPHRIVHSAPDPWTLNACPAVADPTNSRTALPSRIATIRMCDLRDTQGGSGTRSPLDALILQLSGLVADLESAPAADPSRCTESEPVASRRVMVVTDRTRRRDRSSQWRVATTSESTGRRIDVADMHAARAPTSVHPTSDDARAAGPEDRRLRLVPRFRLQPYSTPASSRSSPHRSARRLVPTGSSTGLTWTWSGLRGSPRSACDGPANPCREAENRSRLVVTTDFGDSIAFDFDGCGHFVQTHRSTRALGSCRSTTGPCPPRPVLAHELAVVAPRAVSRGPDRGQKCQFAGPDCQFAGPQLPARGQNPRRIRPRSRGRHRTSRGTTSRGRRGRGNPGRSRRRRHPGRRARERPPCRRRGGPSGR